ncbi:BgtE-3962, partial [Blumeria graminis f. sp. tritici]
SHLATAQKDPFKLNGLDISHEQSAPISRSLEVSALIERDLKLIFANSFSAYRYIFTILVNVVLSTENSPKGKHYIFVPK